MRPASQRFFINSCIYVRILIISYLATFLGTNSSVLKCRKAVNQSGGDSGPGMAHPLVAGVGKLQCDKSKIVG